MRWWLCVAVLLASPAPLQSAVWIVDSAGNGNFIDLPAAVAAAAPGDTLLVRAGAYSGTRISRGLQIFGYGDFATAILRTPIVVEGLPAGERVFVQGLRLSFTLSPELLLRVRDCDGTVHVERCIVDSHPFGFWNEPPVVVTRAHLVILNQCSFPGYLYEGSYPRASLEVADSTLHLYDCQIRGPYGGHCTGQRGGLAVSAIRCTLLMSHCTLQGGTGSSGDFIHYPCYLGRGGDAIDVSGSRVQAYGNDVQAGWSGPYQGIGNPQTQNGGTWVGVPQSLVIEQEPLPTIRLSAPLRLSTTVQVEVERFSAHPQVVFVAFARAELLLPPLAGTLWLDPFSAIPLGATSSELGPASVPFFVENEPLAFGFELHFQAIDVRGRLGAPTAGVLQ